MPSLLAILLAFVYASASAQTIAPPPGVSARAWLVMDYSTGQILAEHEGGTRAEPASLTKVMTTYLVAAALKQKAIAPEQRVTISERAWRTGGSRTFLQVGSQARVEDLFRGMVIQSGNDASVALAEAVGGTEDNFAERMNREAVRLGLQDTHFLNASGYFEGPQAAHHSTPRDLAHLAAALIRDHPEAHALHAVKEFTWDGIRQPNRNRLLWRDPSVDGLKTGHSSAAGYCLIATAKRGPRRLISVVLGTPSEDARAGDSMRLLEWGFTAFDAAKLYDKGQTVSQLKVFKGEKNLVRAGFSEDFVVPLPKGTLSTTGTPGTAGSTTRLAVKLESRQPLLAPIVAGSQVATLRLSFDGKPWGDYPVVALEDIPVAGILGRAWDSLRMLFE